MQPNRICIQILYTSDWLGIAKIMLPNVIEYTKKHNYSIDVKCVDSPFDGYEKLRQIKEKFDNDKYDVVVSMDCDTLITSHKHKIEDLLDSECDAVFNYDYNGLNCGVFILKNTTKTKQVIDSALLQQGFNGMECEQDALNKVKKYFNYRIVPQYKMNSYLYELYNEIPPQDHNGGQWEQGDWLLHLPAISMDKRKELLNEFKEKIIYE